MSKRKNSPINPINFKQTKNVKFKEGPNNLLSIIEASAADTIMGLEVNRIHGPFCETRQDTQLHRAVNSGNFEEATRLINEENANVEAMNSFGYTPIHYAAAQGNIQLLMLMESKSTKPFNLVKSFFNLTIAHMATFTGQTECLDFILDRYFSNIEAKKILTYFKETIADTAARYGHVKCLDHILKKHIKDANLDSIAKNTDFNLHPQILLLLVNDYDYEPTKMQLDNLTSRTQAVFLNRLKDMALRDKYEQAFAEILFDTALAITDKTNNQSSTQSDINVNHSWRERCKSKSLDGHGLS